MSGFQNKVGEVLYKKYFLNTMLIPCFPSHFYFGNMNWKKIPSIYYACINFLYTCIYCLNLIYYPKDSKLQKKCSQQLLPSYKFRNSFKW